MFVGEKDGKEEVGELSGWMQYWSSGRSWTRSGVRKAMVVRMFARCLRRPVAVEKKGKVGKGGMGRNEVTV